MTIFWLPRLCIALSLGIGLAHSTDAPPLDLPHIMQVKLWVENAKTISSIQGRPDASKNQRYAIGYFGLSQTKELMNQLKNPHYKPTDEVLTSFLVSYVLADKILKNPHDPSLLRLGARPDQPENSAVIDNTVESQVIYKPATNEFTGIRFNPTRSIIAISLPEIVYAYEKLALRASKNNANLLPWTQALAKIIDVYFKEPYKDDPNRLNSWKIDGHECIVYRPNHSLAHGLRQGLFALDIVEGLLETQTLNSQEAIEFIQWLKHKVLTDPNFKNKVEIASAFQRTGRDSEKSSSSNKTLYDKYERQDAINFEKDMKKYVGPDKLFKDDLEMQTYKEAILWSTAHEGMLDPATNEDLLYLRKLLHAAHHLDLRRMLGFSPQITKSNAMKELFGDNSVIDINNFSVPPALAAEQTFINKLWERSGEYMEATADRDNSVIPKRKERGEKFCILSHNPDQMAAALVEKRKSSKIQF